MKTVFVVIEKSWHGNKISKIFENYSDAVNYLVSVKGPDELYDFDSAFKYNIEKWEVS